MLIPSMVLQEADLIPKPYVAEFDVVNCLMRTWSHGKGS